ncbi:unnamed protein product [Lactuca virosa]|uniref:Uncharacterized protein n=1 Tax=Lactuca virosa TaxID=75947 RepID=A0AAU9PS23_9ASTR|nr:unnamed protein product [Lactuca virosa]
MGNLKTPILANKNYGILKLKGVIEKLQKSLLPAKKCAPKNTNLRTEPEDVKEGHFVVIAADEDEEKRFVVPLAYLARPSFQRLLERAAEEYGFGNEGALTVPCRPSDLEWILHGAHSDMGWSSYVATVKS